VRDDTRHGNPNTVTPRGFFPYDRRPHTTRPHQTSKRRGLRPSRSNQQPQRRRRRMRNVNPDFTDEEQEQIMADVDQIGDRMENRLRGLTTLTQPDRE